METESRKFARREIDLVVHIEIADGSAVDAEMLDLSQSGVRLKVSNPDSLPGQFMLRLSDKLHRWSRIAWRSTDEIGVEFVFVREEPIAPQESVIKTTRKFAVVIKCPRTGRELVTGIVLTAADDLGKLQSVRRFTQCPGCKAVHGWMPSDASLYCGP
jgi:hypothetical protein